MLCPVQSSAMTVYSIRGSDRAFTFPNSMSLGGERLFRSLSRQMKLIFPPEVNKLSSCMYSRNAVNPHG